MVSAATGSRAARTTAETSKEDRAYWIQRALDDADVGPEFLLDFAGEHGLAIRKKLEEEAAQRQAARAKHEQEWAAAEALGADRDALQSAVAAFKESPSDEALTLILKALAMLPEASVVVGSTISDIKKPAQLPPALLRKTVQKLRTRNQVAASCR